MKTLLAALVLAALAVPATQAEIPLPTDIPYCITTECGSVVPSDCELQEATPNTVGGFGVVDPRELVWGAYDPQECDVDVEPIGACAPPSGQTTERHILFLHVTLLLCDGGIDPPVWS